MQFFLVKTEKNHFLSNNEDRSAQTLESKCTYKSLNLHLKLAGIINMVLELSIKGALHFHYLSSSNHLSL